jgi:hypothetical protein
VSCVYLLQLAEALLIIISDLLPQPLLVLLSLIPTALQLRDILIEESWRLLRLIVDHHASVLVDNHRSFILVDYHRSIALAVDLSEDLAFSEIVALPASLSLVDDCLCAEDWAVEHVDEIVLGVFRLLFSFAELLDILQGVLDKFGE